MRIAAIAHFLRRILLAWLLSMPLLAAQAPAAGVDPALLAPLAGDDTDAKLRAIAALGQLPDPGAAAVSRKGSTVPSGTVTAPIRAGFTAGSIRRACAGSIASAAIPAAVQAEIKVC